MKTERCETCFRLQKSSDMTTRNGARVCVAHVASTGRKRQTAQSSAPRVFVELAQRESVEHERCERCMRVFDTDVMTNYESERLCPNCQEKAKRKWYAIAVYASENKTKKNITRMFKAQSLSHTLHKILIPKQEQARKTLNRYDVYDDQDRVIGTVSAEDTDDAMFKAQAQFGKPKKKTLYRPDDQNDVLDKIEQTKIQRRTYYLAISNTGRLMGRVSGAKNLKKATEMLTRLYGPKDAPTNPRESAAQPSNVAYVRMSKQGGKVLVQNRKSMGGYMLVQIDDDPLSFDTLKRAAGVYTVLPYYDPIDYEAYERDLDNGVYHTPASIPDEQVAKLIEPKKDKSLVIKVGDVVEMIESGIKAKVKEIDGETVLVEMTVMNRPVEAVVTKSQIRK